MRFDLFLVPGPVKENRLADRAVVIIDVLRASTTMCQALQAGARAILPFAESGEAAEMRIKIGLESTLLCGERNGLKIENFDLGNSPSEFTPERVRDKIIIMTTSNGTRAYAGIDRSSLIITGALVNMSRVTRAVADSGRDVAIMCAGRLGQFSIEDTLCGGLLIHRLLTETGRRADLNDAASLALLLYRSNSRALKETIAQGEHGRYLRELGFADDVALAAGVDTIPVLPVLKDKRIINNDVE